MDDRTSTPRGAAAPLASLLESILTPSPLVFAVGLAIVLLLPVLLHFILVASTPYSTLPTVLLLGAPGAGKTSLAARAERGPDAPLPDTHTSQVPLVVELSAARGAGYRGAAGETVADGGPTAGHTKFALVDVPGHPKLRSQAIDRLAPAALEAARVRGVVFVVDAAALADRRDETVAETAEFLHAVLLALQRRAAAAKKRPRPIPVLIAANKADLFTAMPPAAVRAALEGELTRIRSSRSRGLLDSGVSAEDIGSEEQDGWLGQYGAESGFGFEQMAEFGVDVHVQAGSVRGGDTGRAGIDSWWAWITEVL